MSRYQIVPVVTEEIKEGDITVLDVRGLNSTSVQKDDLRVIGKNSLGVPKFLTGLNPDHLKKSPVLNEEQKQQALSELKADLKILESNSLGASDIAEDNQYTWRDQKMGAIVLDPSVKEKYFDTSSNPRHIIIKYAILAGSYDIIAPSREKALELNTPYYYTSIEAEARRTYAPTDTKLRAGAELYNFLQNSDEKTVRDFCWYLHEKTRGFTKTNTIEVMSTSLTEYLDSKLTKEGKEKTAKRMLEALDTWRKDPEYVRLLARLHVADNYALIYFDKNQGSWVVSKTSLPLAPTKEAAVEVLRDPSKREEASDLLNDIKKELEK